MAITTTTPSGRLLRTVLDLREEAEGDAAGLEEVGRTAATPRTPDGVALGRIEEEEEEEEETACGRVALATREMLAVGATSESEFLYQGSPRTEGCVRSRSARARRVSGGRRAHDVAGPPSLSHHVGPLVDEGW